METLYIEELQIQSKITVKKMRSIDLNVLTSFGILYFSSQSVQFHATFMYI